ncbi:MAG: hypothetical protein QME74_02155 [Candidatus Edwardsbacteria bacterium]|nr:hypothetical protein [Candidatus Edwardsbacteria bacterium]
MRLRLRLRLFFYGALAASACGGCLSVDIETRADRKGGGARAYVVTLDPSLAKTYESATGQGKLFKLPGDDLVDKAGVALVSRSQEKDTSGGLTVKKTFRADRLSDAGTDADSIRYAVTRSGLWVNYRYDEHYLASGIDSARVMGTYGERYRFRHVLQLPGRMVRTNADTTRGRNAVWSRPMRQVRAEGLVMSAESREIDPLVWAALFFIILTTGVLMIIFKLRRTAP